MLRLALGVLAAAAACTPAQYARQADRSAYGLVGEKQARALGTADPLDVTYRPIGAPTGAAATQPCATMPAFFRGQPIPTAAQPPRVLSLEECLEIAVSNSRPFQTRKEDLYRTALALANMRHDWSLVAGNIHGVGGANAQGKVGNTYSGGGDATLSFAQKFATGGAATLAAGLDAATNFLNIRDTGFGSLLSANLTQPLWRGAWHGFAYEGLYRAERDFLYSILSYERFTQTFAVGIAQGYWSVLQNRDQLTNETENLRRLDQTAKFTRAQVEAGMLSRVQSDQAEQNVFNAQARIENVRQVYLNSLDQFKLTLGLPLSASIELDQKELARLAPRDFPYPVGEAEEIALHTRPDVLETFAAVRDARRDVEMAADAFNPQLDVVLSSSAPGREPRTPFQTQFQRNTRAAGVTFDYALDQWDNRDAYRLSQIADEKARRNLVEMLDNVRMDVRRTYRSLQESRRLYEIQMAAVALALRRTRLAQLEQKEGLASTRDVLEAEDALRSSRNALTSALVGYASTRLNLLATLGMIRVDGQGQIREREQPVHVDRYVPREE